MLVENTFLPDLLVRSRERGSNYMPKNNRFGQAAVISHQEYSRIRKCLHNIRHKLLLDIAWYTGERWGAIVRLQVRDVFTEDNRPREFITFRSGSRKGDDRTRQVPVHPSLGEMLRGFKFSDSHWLFPGRQDDLAHLTMRGATWIFDQAVALAKLDNRGISTHSTRRSFITHLHEHGVDIKVIQEITGHKDLKSLQLYVEVSPDRVKKAIALLGAA
jgi:integrase/recombinase XerD